MNSIVVVFAALAMTADPAAVAAAQVPEAVSAPVVVSRTIQLSKVVLDTETNEVVARVKGGTWCVFPSDVKLPKEKKTQDYERFDNLFTAKMKTSGFAVVSTSNDMFAGESDKNKADYLIGATMRPTAMNTCSSVKGYKGDFSVLVDWQIYDRAAGKVVETITTSGQGVQAQFSFDGEKEMINQAFAASLNALIDKGVLQKYAKSPATP